VQVSSDSSELLLLLVFIRFILELLRIIFDGVDTVEFGLVGLVKVKAANWFKVIDSVAWLDVLLLLWWWLFAKLRVEDELEFVRCIDLWADDMSDDEFEFELVSVPLPFWWFSAKDWDIFEKLRSMNWFILCETPFFL